MKNFSIRHTVIITLAIFLISCNHSAYEIGASYPKWNEGEMEIHFISTGHGESQFLILPDGTSMLIDAGDHDPKLYKKLSEARPDSSRRSGEWIARYVKQRNPHKDKVDYLVVSHFHSDHMGLAEQNLNLKYSKDSSYILSGITEAGQTIRFAKVIDRGYPNYDKPIPVRYKEVDNYRIFIDEKAKEYGLKQEAFEIGSNRQFHLTKKPE
ncbi:MAG: MBL fold metallo-hydrolase, partial [Bacteroidaceae bacterium]|nr:MBL fold metallo-hydrolase [Bacteroidaceae bacterium]